MSPIDLIPDFISVIGYLDDVMLIPMGIACLIKMIPQDILDECREKAKSQQIHKERHWIAASVVIVIWLLAIFIMAEVCWHYFKEMVKS